MDLGGRADRFKFLIRVRGGRFTKTFDEVFAVNGVRIIRSPVRSLGRIPSRSGMRERHGASALTIC